MHLKHAVALLLCLVCVACTTGPNTANAAASKVPVKGAPPLGDYMCSMVIMAWDGMWRSEDKGMLTLISPDTYKYNNGDDRGTYTFDPTTKKVKFKTGFFQDAAGTLIPRDKVWQLDVDFATKTPMTWNCAQNKTK